MDENNKYVRFDWAAKRMLRDKANFAVLEGLVTVLLNEEIKIVEILESESNPDYILGKYNRVDVLAKNSKGEIIIVEIQQARELYYLERILYGVAKTITDHISLGDKYDKVKKVYSINILYFPLGKGADYLYHGKTRFIGVHTGDTLQMNNKDKDFIRMKDVDDIFPEYFIIRVNEFNKVAKTPLEEWMEYLKNGNIREDTTAPGLKEAKEKLQYMRMSREEQRSYFHHIDEVMVNNDMVDTARMEGMAKGRAEGIAEGRAEGIAEGRAEEKYEIARNLKKNGIAADMIALSTGLSVEEIEKL